MGRFRNVTKKMTAVIKSEMESYFSEIKLAWKRKPENL
jgi:hypothetical protein